MKASTALFALAALTAAGCAWNYEPWIAYADHAAIADPGVKSLIGSHARYEVTDDQCVTGTAPALVLDKPGAHGETSFEPMGMTIEAPGTACDGLTVDATAVYYNGLVDAAYDEITYRELLAPAEPDVIHTAHIRVR